MAINVDVLRQAVSSIAACSGLHMDPNALVEDVVLLARAFPKEEDFMAACASTRRAIDDLIAGRVSSTPLKYDFQEWRSYHYQHRVGQGAKASCRIVFRVIDGGIEVKGFGHRRVPADIYVRMAKSRKEG